VTELDGLGKGSTRHESREHGAMVQRAAGMALTFLHQQLSGPGASHLRILTAKGNTLNTIAYRTEEEGVEVTVLIQ
jgi:hypothetical protein